MSSESPVAVATPSVNGAAASAPSSSPPAPEAKGYEFTAEQNELVGSVARKMQLVGLIFLVFGAVSLICAFLFQLLFPQLDHDLMPPDVRDQLTQIGSRDRWIFTGYVTVVGILALCVGAWTRAAGGSFLQIVKTSGKDISHLMEGFKTLNKMYSLIGTALVAAIFACLVLVIVRNFA
jgi:hypothetical protein